MRRLLIVMVLLLAGCTASHKQSASPGGTDTCPATPATQPTERQGRGDGVEMWALLMPTSPALLVNEDIKIVIRITGDRDVIVNAVGPNGRVVEPQWGPEWHSSSSFNRPGNEFGVGWRFPSEGCWQLKVANHAGVGVVTIRVGLPAPE